MNVRSRDSNPGSQEQEAPNSHRSCSIIEVSQVERAKEPLPEASFEAALACQLMSRPKTIFKQEQLESCKRLAIAVEACSSQGQNLVANVYVHPVIGALHRAFATHRPLALSPDIIWLLVIQAFANHVHVNAEELRSRFVRHSGKKDIVIIRNDFVKGAAANPWSEVIDEFSEEVRKHIGESTHGLLLPSFSTTGDTEKIAAQVVLLGAMRSYFDYFMYTICGIPQIVLEGTVDDWERLTERTREFGQFGLDWWLEILMPILDEITAAVKGKRNQHFWQSIYKHNSGSGGPYSDGWISAFFPYLHDQQTGLATDKNPWFVPEERERVQQLRSQSKEDLRWMLYTLRTEVFPGGLTQAPFQWNYFDQTHEMEFLAGFVGVRQDPETLCLRPEIGWAVRESQA